MFIGVLGTAPDSSYEISVSEYLFHDHQAGHAGVTGIVHSSMLQDRTPTTVTIAPQSYMFFELYVGPMDEAMQVTERSGAGSRTGDLGTDPDTWGIDWTEQLTQTWVEQQQDEWDLDVDVSIDVTGSDLTVYGSSREPSPSSLERAGSSSAGSPSSATRPASVSARHEDSLAFYGQMSGKRTGVSVCRTLDLGLRQPPVLRFVPLCLECEVHEVVDEFTEVDFPVFVGVAALAQKPNLSRGELHPHSQPVSQSERTERERERDRESERERERERERPARQGSLSPQ